MDLLSEAFDRAKSAIKRLPDALDELTETARVMRERETPDTSGSRWLIAGLGVIAGASAAIAVLLAVM